VIRHIEAIMAMLPYGMRPGWQAPGPVALTDFT
jgi:hypothetical protein